ncbi:MAG: hypothetical protein ACXVEF_05265 [Polyangiales bacterium]
MRAWWVAVLPFLGCADVLGVEVLSTAPPVEFAYSSPDCESCVEASCAAERDVCAGDRGCAALFAQVSKCASKDAACRARAERAFPDVNRTAAFLALDTCRRQSCTRECVGGIGYAKLDPRCACIDDVCAAQAIACAKSPETALAGSAATSEVGDCERTFGCALADGFPDPGRTLACLHEYPTDGAAIGALFTCAGSTACDHCPLATGSVLQCAGNWQYPVVTDAAELPATYEITDHGGAPVADALVEVCPYGCECLEHPASVRSARTGTDGKTAIVLERELLANTTCTRISKSGYLSLFRLREPQIYPTAGKVFPESLLMADQLDAGIRSIAGTPPVAVYMYVNDCAEHGVSGVHVDAPKGVTIVYSGDTTTATDGALGLFGLPVGDAVHITVKRDTVTFFDDDFRASEAGIYYLDLLPPQLR